MARTRWLDSGQQQAWRAYLRGSARLESALEEQLRPIGLGLGEYQILVTLSEAPGHRMRLADLATSLVHSRSRLTHTMDRMAKAGWVTRDRCVDDKRGVLAVLTDEGFSLLRRIAPGHAETVRDLFVDVAGDRFTVVGDVFAAVADAVEASGDCDEARQRVVADQLGPDDAPRQQRVSRA